MKEGIDSAPNLKDEIDGLAGQLEELIGVCAKLQSDNSELRTHHDKLQRDNEFLHTRNREAKQRVDKIIGRLHESDGA